MSLRDRLASGSFAVTAEISPPRGASTDPVAATAALLRDWVDAVNVTDNQGSNVRLASWAGSLAALHAGLEPVMQMTCRDRNRIALQSDLLGASALGIRNILVMTGDHPKFGDHPEARPVFDLDSGLPDAAAHARPGRRAVRPGAEAAPRLLPRRGGEPLRPAR